MELLSRILKRSIYPGAPPFYSAALCLTLKAWPHVGDGRSVGPISSEMSVFCYPMIPIGRASNLEGEEGLTSFIGIVILLGSAHPMRVCVWELPCTDIDSCALCLDSPRLLRNPQRPVCRERMMGRSTLSTAAVQQRMFMHAQEISAPSRCG